MTRTLVALLLVSAAVSCKGPPEKEAPVSLRPGPYQVSIGSGTLLELRFEKPLDEICYSVSDAAAFVSAPLVRAVKDWPGCSSDVEQKGGNALGGSRVCSNRAMPMTLKYHGRHDEQSFRIDGTISQSDNETSSVSHLGSGDFWLAGKRIGDCNA